MVLNMISHNNIDFTQRHTGFNRTSIAWELIDRLATGAAFADILEVRRIIFSYTFCGIYLTEVKDVCM
jgi:hypothetical protein